MYSFEFIFCLDVAYIKKWSPVGVCISPIKDDSICISIHGVRYDSETFILKWNDSIQKEFDSIRSDSMWHGSIREGMM